MFGDSSGLIERREGSGGGEAGTISGKDERGRVDEFGERSTAANRWPRQETVALLRIRSDMDGFFRDSSLKAPLWEEVSRKMGGLGYHRNPKKCKEKFENVYKYHKRTKDGRAAKSDGKTYRFFDQLQSLISHAPPPQPLAPLPISITMPSTTITTTTTVSSTKSASESQQQQNPVLPDNYMSQHHQTTTKTTTTPSFSWSSTSSENNNKDQIWRRKRKWMGFFEGLMKEVMEKQEDFQRRFLDAIERRDRDRVAREEAWKAQETARLDRERRSRIREQAAGAAKEAALFAFLQKLSEQHGIPLPPQLLQQNPNSLQQSLPPRAQPETTMTMPPPESQQKMNQLAIVAAAEENVNTRLRAGLSSSRWPIAEVETLIDLRTKLEQKYEESGPKGPLWEEISADMRRLGYNRNAKRCKEKWENINKYYKKVKESNKRRPEDSKTCPYFHQLEAIYRQKTMATSNTTKAIMPADGKMSFMARPEQQWPLPKDPRSGDNNGDHMNDHVDDEDDGNEEDDEDDQGYEFVASNNAVGTAAAEAMNG
ncbi:Trihelix transcription factor DF1-like protein [Drosera capensis]